MKVKTEVVAVARDGKQDWTGARLVTVELAASGDHDSRYFKVQIPAHHEKSFPCGRRVILEIRPL